MAELPDEGIEKDFQKSRQFLYPIRARLRTASSFSRSWQNNDSEWVTDSPAAGAGRIPVADVRSEKLHKAKCCLLASAGYQSRKTFEPGRLWTAFFFGGQFKSGKERLLVCEVHHASQGLMTLSPATAKSLMLRVTAVRL